jgi:glyceraldehyde-3-phosphate dehydrogenase/erythrose-4-phosphate dehydrogenase
MTRIGIKGYGRIGRFVFRPIAGRLGKEIEVVAVNDIVPPPTTSPTSSNTTPRPE